jgi:SAM-dependent methyltransferase
MNDQLSTLATEFSEEQYRDAYPDGIENHWWNLTRNRIVLNAVRKYAGNGAAVLDVGCGRGFVVNYLQDAGIDCSGVEPALARPLNSVRNHVRMATEPHDLALSERMRYDTILLLDVIEHVPEPISFLKRLIDDFPRLLQFIVTVPARQELWSNYDACYGHCRRYDLEMLQKTAAAIGADCIRAGYFFHLSYPLGWAAAHLLKKRETTFEVPQGIVARSIHRLMAGLMILDGFLMPGWVPGMSALACFGVKGSGY